MVKLRSTSIAKGSELSSSGRPTEKKKLNGRAAAASSKKQVRNKIDPTNNTQTSNSDKKNKNNTVDSEDFDSVRARLHVSAIPDFLPGREKELSDITSQIQSSVENDATCCLYISGVPGTGKTASVRAAIQTLQTKADSKLLPKFNFLELNGMQVTDPNQIYVKLWEAIGNTKTTHLHALDCLREYFQGKKNASKRDFWVVVVDELDVLMTKKQEVMYNLFEWPYCPGSRIIIIAIANTMDLPERMLTHKVASRMGLIRVVFHPYSFQQLQNIVSERLKSVAWFDKYAVEICARKVAAISGDARRALDICRRAVEIIEVERSLCEDESEKEDKKVQIKTITQAIEDMYKSPCIKYVEICSLQQKIVLTSVIITIKSQGISEVALQDVFTNYNQLCRINNWPQLVLGRLLQTVSTLVSFNLLMGSVTSYAFPLTPYTPIAFSVRSEDVSTALRLDDRFKKLV